MPVNELFRGMRKPILIMDGGLGTSLEETCKTQITGTPLWSAEAITKEPEAIVAVHLAFLRAGAEVIETSTYQCSFDTLERAGYTRDDAWQVMRQAVLLAQQARTLFNEEKETNNKRLFSDDEQSRNPHIRLCLSLGPFGASLKPTQEFGGFYPPPYGPRKYSAAGPNINYMDDEALEDEAIEALTAFHTKRLSLFAQDSEIWSYIDMIAFETVPLAREAISIRRTMTRLQEKGMGVGKQWWISFVFPDGRCPQMRDANGTRLAISDFSRAALSLNLPNRLGGRKLAAPHGIGINCTAVQHLSRIVEELESVLNEIEGEGQPFLVLYPNGGDEFDESLGVWKRSGETVKSEWATKLVDLVDRILNSPDVNWSGVVVGGCCRCSAEQICRLSRKLK
ncbi:Homocysteine S-methyltransferase 4 [Leucoagaricus sp. SymC.cos]|nr:Homocysteine S-methyltransferase 4 [Leucoagaricus sp. SymC.cos]